jgi:hypothetical protein
VPVVLYRHRERARGLFKGLGKQAPLASASHRHAHALGARSPRTQQCARAPAGKRRCCVHATPQHARPDHRCHGHAHAHPEGGRNTRNVSTNERNKRCSNKHTPHLTRSNKYTHTVNSFVLGPAVINTQKNGRYGEAPAAAASWRALDGRRQRGTACPLLIFRSNGAPASLPPASSSLAHARRMDGFCNQNADQFGSLAGLSLLTVYVGVGECAPASLPPASSSLTHARRMDGFCNQNADQLGSLAGPSLLTVYVGVVECAPASPYTYSSSTHRFPYDRTPIEVTPLSATSAELGLGLGQGLGLDSLSHSSSHALPFFSPTAFHTLSLSPAFTSVWWSA